MYSSYSDSEHPVRCTIFSNMLRFCIILLFAAGNFQASTLAQTHQNVLIIDFEEGLPRWEASTAILQESISSQALTNIDFHTGLQCEQLVLNSPRFAESEGLALGIPASRVFNEFQIRVAVRSNCLDLQLACRIRFPHQIDPRSGTPLVLELVGTPYSAIGKWQELEINTTDQAVAERLRLARAEFLKLGNPIQINTQDMYIDQITIHCSVPKGVSEIRIDDVKVGPIVPATNATTPKNTIQYDARLKIADDQILKDGAPFFPVFTMYHDESLQEIQKTGVNTLWVPDYANRALLQTLEELQIGAFAQPPQLTPEEAVLGKKGLPPFTESTQPIWAWMFGYSIPEEDLRYVSSWIEQVQDADRNFHRPVIADVEGNERSFHRKLDFMGSSQFAIHSAISMPRHAQQLNHRRNMALPGKPMFTFVQTEAFPTLIEDRRTDDAIPIVEPEQILHQGYAAIAAGFKGVGFWKQFPLDTDLPGLNERSDAIKLFAIHSKILEPFIASGRVVDEYRVRKDSEFQGQQAGITGVLKSRWDTPIQQAGVTQPIAASEIRAAQIRSPDGILILPVWYEDGEQCVPGAQAANRIRFLVKGDIWQAWEVTPVEVTQANLEVSWPAGGTEICLKRFDQQSAIVITSSPEVIERLQRKCRMMRDEAATAAVSLASLKFQRVQSVHERLVQLGVRVENPELLLRQAYGSLERAKRELDSEHPVDAYAAAQQSLQSLRRLQRSYWDLAIADLPSAVTSLDAASFQTLPQHWQLLAELGQRTRPSENLIPSGDFESGNALENQWMDGSTPIGRKRIQRQYDRTRNDHHLSLDIQSPPDEDGLIALTGPEIEVFKDDLVVITAQVRVRKPFVRAEDSFLLFDTLYGSQGAFQIASQKPGWETVKLIRRVPRDTRLRIRMELRGNGSVDVDDLSVYRLLP